MDSPGGFCSLVKSTFVFFLLNVLRSNTFSRAWLLEVLAVACPTTLEFTSGTTLIYYMFSYCCLDNVCKVL